jgi:YVTN family beta-propeller protein
VSRLAAFLFADIRGFTRFTEREGAERASALAAALVSMAAEIAAAHRGRLRGSWGDQVLLEFESPSDAVRAAGDLQRRCIEATVADPSLPLHVGVGLDIGDAAVTGDSVTAAGLNVAARLCAKAGAGEVLATSQLTHTAGAVPGQLYVEHGRLKLKGLARPTAVVLVRPPLVDRDRERRFQESVRLARDERQAHRLRWWVAALTAAAVAAGLSGWALSRWAADDPVAVPRGGVAIVDPGTARVVDAVRVGGTPSGVASGAGGVWVTRSGDGTLARIDVGDRRTVPIDSVSRAAVAVAVTARDVWTVDGAERFVRRVNASVNREVRQVPVGNQPVAVAVGAGAVWVANRADNTVMRIDAETGRVTDTIRVGRGPSGLTVAAGTVWVANGRDGTVTPIDARTMLPGPPIRVGAGPRGIVATSDGVWVANSLGLSVSHIDARTLTVTTLPVGESPVALATAGGSVWVAVAGDGTLARIDQARHVLLAPVPLGASPTGVVAVDGKLWVATRPFRSDAHVGGTLTVAAYFDLGQVDPARVGEYTNISILRAVYDGLVTLRKADGADGLDLVPDLAESVPQATDGGRTYTFTVRRGIRYSDGRLLHPADFRHGLAREFTATRQGTAGGDPTVYAGIVGARRCMTPGGRSCDLTAGITTGPHTVTFHLTRPDSEFPYKLSLLYAAPAPPGSPTAGAPATRPIPGTGPYRVTAPHPKQQVLLTRNPHFRPWSDAAQPPGYPDRIRFVAMPGPQASSAVLAGTVDVMALNSDPQNAEDIAVRHPDQVRQSAPGLGTGYLALNTNRAPFTDARARRAFAYALDRARLAAINGGGPNCQLLPAGLPGYEPHCPFTTNPNPEGLWHGPDLDKARQLVRQSGTHGHRVVVRWNKREPAGGRYIVSVLRDLGYDAHLQLTPLDAAYAHLRSVDVIFQGWAADFPAPSNFYQPLLSCGGSANPGAHCDPALDRLAASAIAVQETDPGLSDQRWRRVYRKVVDDALVIPFYRDKAQTLVSRRVGNLQSSPLHGTLYDQLWVR